MAGYVLATAFDRIWLQPGGELGLLGVGVETTFLRGALDRLGIEPQLDQRHEYKNAADRIMRTGFTEAHRAALDRLAESVFGWAVEAIAEGRRLDADTVRALVDEGPHQADRARQARLVDALGYRDQAQAAIRERVGECEPLFADRWRPRRRPHLPRRPRGHVALVEVRGAITSGRSRRLPTGRTAGSDSVGAAVRAAAADHRVRAVVLRIDSRGGSAVASETIWREVSLLRQAKPVVVSMGEAAASGGYYIACPAHAILAQPSTVTGSIGVFGGKVVVQDLLDRLGLSTGTVTRGEHALMFSARRRFDAQEVERLAAALDATYDDFVAKVAQGRGRSVAAIESVARGRVWTGSDGVVAGLVDRLGGLRDAVQTARALAGLPDDAPLRPAIRLGPFARLTRPKNSADPRAGVAADWPRVSDLAATLGVRTVDSLQMPPIRLR